MAYITEQKRIDVVKLCDTTNTLPIYSLNRYGGIDMFLFNNRVDTQNEVKDITYYKQYSEQRWNTRTATTLPTATESRKVQRIYKDLIDSSNANRYHNLATQGQMFGVKVFVRKYFGTVAITDFSSTIAGTVLVTSESHLLRNGDTVKLSETTDYNGTYSIRYIDKNSFAIIATYTSDRTGVFNKSVVNSDFLHCYLQNVAMTDTTTSSTFSFTADLCYPDN